MRALLVPFALSVAMAAGCGGTGFTAGVTQVVNLHFGKMTPGCNTAGASTTIPGADGSSSSFVHRMSSGVCLITTQWKGPLINMNALRQQIARDEPNAEKNLVGLHIKHIDVDVNHVSFRDMQNDAVLDAPDSAYLQYDEALNFAAAQPFTHLTWINDSQGNPVNSSENPNHPHISTPGERTMEDALNKRIAADSTSDIVGTGQLTLRLDGSRINDFLNATDPALQVHLDYDVTGGATNSGENGESY